MRYFYNRKFRSLCSLIFMASISNVTYASGFALIEMNASGQGNAYAGAAAETNDASTIFFNPAGMMQLENDQLVVAGHLIVPKASFDNDGSTGSSLLGSPALTGGEDDGGFNALVPNLYWVKTLDDSMKFGLGVNSPFGLATKYDDDWVGRYHGVVSDLKIINVNPSLGYQLNDQVSIGGGLDIMLGHVELSSAIDFGAICVASFNAATCAGLGSLPQESDGFVEFEGDNFDNLSIGFNFGVMIALTPETDIGIAYRSEVDMKMEGDASFAVPSSSSFVFANNLFIDSGIEAEVALPASLSFSASHKVDKMTYLADLTWTGWSSFEELRIEYDNEDQPDSVTTEDWDDTMRYSVGFNYQYSEKMILRAGIALDESPVPSAERRTPRLPGSDRTWFSVGMGYVWSEDLIVDVGFSHLEIDDAPIENEFESSVPTLAATLEGEYSASVDILSVQLTWQL